MLTNLCPILVLGVAAILISSSGAGAMAPAKRSVSFYVSPNGNDAWSGTKASPDRKMSDGPFATVSRAQSAIRELRKKDGVLPGPVTVWLRGGMYPLTHPVVFTPEDSGTPEAPITYAAYRGEKPIISGGREITGWHPTQIDGKKLWAARVPEVKDGKWNFHQLFVNGGRRDRTRLPKEGFHRVQEIVDPPQDLQWNRGQKQFRYAEGDLKSNWRNPGDIDIISFTLWIEARMPLESVDESNRIAHLASPSTFWLRDDHNPQGARYCVENVFEALDTPGQWYLDRPSGTLYYMPMPGENSAECSIIAPKLSQALCFEGDAKKGQYVSHLRFRGITFSHTEWRYPAGQSGSGQADTAVPGAISFEAARQCVMQDCAVTHIGNYAVQIGEGCDGVKLVGNTLSDMGAGGIKVSGGVNTTIQDNEIADGGRIYPSGVGVLIQNSGYNRVLHNHIHDLYYTGVSVGWSWGYAKSPAVSNVIEYNHIHDIGKGLLSDMGGIYTLGVSPGTRLRYNLIHDINAYSYGGWGIYLDEGSTGILVENNVVYRTKTGGFHQHYGQDNMIRNNVFAYASVGQIQRTRIEDHLSFTFENNIVYWNKGPLLHGSWADANYHFDRNVYFGPGGGSVDFAGLTLEQWREKGMDRNGLIADPKFVAPEKGDYRLQPDSPALKLGFKSIDLSKVGPLRKRLSR